MCRMADEQDAVMFRCRHFRDGHFGRVFEIEIYALQFGGILWHANEHNRLGQGCCNGNPFILDFQIHEDDGVAQ